MNLLMLTGDTSLPRGAQGAFYNTLSEFAPYWDKIDVLTPPVRGVTHIDCQRGQEKIGSCRRVGYDFGGKRKGHYFERRTEQVPGKRIAFEIYEDSGPILKVLSRPGAALDIEPAGPGKTRVVFSFYHDPKGMGRLLNRFVILPDMRKNRLAALQSLKRWAESGKT